MSVPPPLRLLIRKGQCRMHPLKCPSRRIIHSVSHKIFALLPCCLTPFSCSGIVAESHLFWGLLWDLRFSWQEWDPEHQNSQMILACIVMGEWSSKPGTEKSDWVIDMGGGGGLIQIYFYVGNTSGEKAHNVCDCMFAPPPRDEFLKIMDSVPPIFVSPVSSIVQ